AQTGQQVRPGDVAALHQQVEETAAGGLVLGGGAVEVGGGEQPLADQNLGQPLLHRLVQGIRGDDLAAQEGDGNDVLQPLDGQDAGLLLLRDQLQDLGQLEEIESAFNRHGQPSSAVVCRAGGSYVVAQLHPEPDAEIERQAEDRHDPGHGAAG